MKFTLIQQHKAGTLCESCSSGTIARSAHGRVSVHCSEFCRDSQPVQPVVECSGYAFKWGEAPYEMKDMAWDITLDKARTRVGFISPQERKK